MKTLQISLLFLHLFLSVTPSRAADINSLPDEMVPLILDYLEQPDLVAMSAVAQYYRGLVANQIVDIHVTDKNLDMLEALCKASSLPFKIGLLTFKSETDSRENIAEQINRVLNLLGNSSAMKDIHTFEFAPAPRFSFSGPEGQGVMASILALPKLSRLVMHNTVFADSIGEQVIGAMELRELKFFNVMLSKKALYDVASCPHLRKLVLKDYAFHLPEIEWPTENIVMSPELETFEFGNFRDSAPMQIISAIPNLTKLSSLTLMNLPKAFNLDGTFIDPLLKNGLETLHINGKFDILDSIILPKIVSYFPGEVVINLSEYKTKIDASSKTAPKLHLTSSVNIEPTWLFNAVLASSHSGGFYLNIPPNTEGQTIQRFLAQAVKPDFQIVVKRPVLAERQANFINLFLPVRTTSFIKIHN